MKFVSSRQVRNMAYNALKLRTSIVACVKCLTFVKLFLWAFLSVISNGEEQTATGGEF